MTAPVLEVRDLTVRYGHVTALEDVSLTVGTGEVVAVVGPNGAGKTTLLRTMSGLVKPASGGISIAGRDVVGLPAYRVARAGLAHVPEGRGTVAPLTVEDNLRLGALSENTRETDRRIAGMYEVFPALGRLKRRRAGLLSGGEQQMLVVARGLMSQPSLLAIDEPSMGLAPIMVRELVGMLRRAAETGVGVLIVEQNLALATQLADRALILVRGTVRASGSRGELPADLLEEFLA
ncbi:ABC transporter ATP-binding protein [Nakamurella alba]|uniref:ABC transporter ATP-binding protein n=1 Tax=Nakamurella alba TaxID=2665158 RepID=UPI0018AAB175|nr:ABC transporter ATP-binding protein [Nakamurella alba]